jgi:hypothetical protein
VPSLTTLAGSWILERFVLESRSRNSDLFAIRQQERAVRRDQMRHRPALPDMTVHPQPAIHGVDHPCSARLELAVWKSLTLCFGIALLVGRPHG